MNAIYGRSAAVLLFLAVALGAFGAHALRGRLDAYSLGVWEKAVFYHFIHALGVLIVFLAARAGVIRANDGNWAALLLLTGIVLFSGSLYVLAVSGVKAFGAVTPLGGLAFLAGWGWLAAALFRSR